MTAATVKDPWTRVRKARDLCLTMAFWPVRWKMPKSHGTSAPMFSRAQAIPNRAKCCARKAEAGQESFDDLYRKERAQRFPSRLRLRTDTPNDDTHHTMPVNSPTHARLCSGLDMSASVTICSDRAAGRYMYSVYSFHVQHVSISIYNPTPLFTTLYRDWNKTYHIALNGAITLSSNSGELRLLVGLLTQRLHPKDTLVSSTLNDKQHHLRSTYTRSQG